MTDAELDRINEERRKRGLPRLTRQQATTAVVNTEQRLADGFSFSDFLIGYMLGIPGIPPSPAGIVGSMLHPSPVQFSGDSGGSASSPPINDTPSLPAYTPSAPDPSPSYDSSPSSYDSGGGGGGGGE